MVSLQSVTGTGQGSTGTGQGSTGTEQGSIGTGQGSTGIGQYRNRAGQAQGRIGTGQDRHRTGQYVFKFWGAYKKVLKVRTLAATVRYSGPDVLLPNFRTCSLLHSCVRG